MHGIMRRHELLCLQTTFAAKEPQCSKAQTGAEACGKGGRVSRSMAEWPVVMLLQHYTLELGLDRVA